MILDDPNRAMAATRRISLSGAPTVTPGRPTYEPNPAYQDQSILILNTGLDLQFAKDFYPVSSSDDPMDIRVEGYTSKDPRLADVLRNDRLVLDRPVYQPAHVQPLCIPDTDAPAPPSSGFAPSYDDLVGGNYQYYLDKDLTQVFFSPVYEIPSTVRPSIFQDPMGSLKPYYEKQPILRRNVALSEYSFDQDQMSFREDLMSRQSSRMDRTDYAKFYHHFRHT